MPTDPTTPGEMGPGMPEAVVPLAHVSALVDEFTRSTYRKHEGPIGMLFEWLDECGGAADPL
jgi:hypothetical protein